MNYKQKKWNWTKVKAVLMAASLITMNGCAAAPGTGSTASTSGASASNASSAQSTASAATASAESTAASAEAVDTGDMFTSRDKEIGYDESAAVSIVLNGTSAQSSSGTVKISGSTVTVTEAGTYILSGSLTNGQIVVDAQSTDKIQLVLNGVTVTCDSSAALYVKQADKVFVTLANGSVNTFSNTAEFVAIDENNIDGVVFAKDDITFNGNGSLTVTAAYGHGVVCKDDLVFTSGTYAVTAASQALSGKESVRIADGTFTLNAGKDGIHAENADDASLGFVYIAGGSYEMTCEGDGVSASATLQIDGGIFRITAGGGSLNAETKQSTNSPFARTAETTAASDTGPSTKGIKSAGNLLINAGTFEINSADDALHSNADLTVAGGTFTISTGDDGMHADANLSIRDGVIHITESYEGIEGQSIDISGGEISLVASDDGINAAGGADQSGFGGKGQDKFSAAGSSSINISGGKILVNATGDGVDSNGNITVSGGETYVCGPTANDNAALDYDGTAVITGGIFVATGASGMAQNFDSSSTQGTMLVTISGEAGAALTLSDSAGNKLISYTPEKTYQCAVISCPEIAQGETYTVSAGSQSISVEMTSLVYGSGGGMGGMGGMGGGFGGGRR